MDRIGVLALVIVVVAIPLPACAYLDAGTGSMLLQMLVAGFAVAAFTIKMQWARIRRRLFRRADNSEPPAPRPSADEFGG